MTMCETPLVSYEGGATFERICPICRRFVKADDMVNLVHPNATCGKCGRVAMPFVGWYDNG